MASEIVGQIREELRRYLAGGIKLYEFEDFFVPLLWDIDQYGDAVAIALAGSIHNLISEYSQHDRSLDSLREELMRIARPFGESSATLQMVGLADRATGPFLVFDERLGRQLFGASVVSGRSAVKTERIPVSSDDVRVPCTASAKRFVFLEDAVS